MSRDLGKIIISLRNVHIATKMEPFVWELSHRFNKYIWIHFHGGTHPKIFRSIFNYIILYTSVNFISVLVIGY